MSEHDRFATYDAAYVLGALSPADRREYEDHLRDCPICAAAVSDLAGMPGLLAQVPAEEARGGVAAPPETLLPGLLDAVRRDRRRSHWIVGGLATTAAACLLVALLVAFWPGGSGGSGAPERTLTPVAGAPIRATAQFTDAEWGTRIRLRCTHDGSGSYGHSGASYAMIVVDRDGHRQQLATWRAAGNHVTTVDATTSLPRSEIADVDVRTVGGPVVLHLR